MLARVQMRRMTRFSFHGNQHAWARIRRDMSCRDRTSPCAWHIIVADLRQAGHLAGAQLDGLHIDGREQVLE